MSAATLPAPLDERRPPLTTLTYVELRKMVDTRAGRWLLAVVGILVVAITIVYALTGPDAEKSYAEFFQVLQLATGVLLPVLGILLVTSEWTQRTALTTFTLVPDRTRIVGAKALAVIAVCAAAIVATLLAAAVGVILSGADGEWTFGGAEFGEIVVMQLAGLLGGLAFGLAFQSSAPAIVLYFVLPTIISILTEVVGALEDVMEWIDLGSATIPFGEGDVTGTEWGRFGTSVLVWVGLPLAIGLWRLWRSEVK
jgi:ABC-type transport system involved in multi-copper enzyme maturation permease subunit